MPRSADPGARRATAFVIVALALALAAALAACGGDAAATPSDGLPPTLIRGRIVDKTDTPVPTKAVQISLLDHAHAKVGEPVPVIYQAQFGVGIDGTFEARIAITPETDAFAATTDHVASFDVVAIGTDGNVVAVFVFPRTIDKGTWAGDVPYLTLRSDGVSELDEHPAQQ
jgi:hypothetical protein